MAMCPALSTLLLYSSIHSAYNEALIVLQHVCVNLLKIKYIQLQEKQLSAFFYLVFHIILHPFLHAPILHHNVSLIMNLFLLYVN